jgi:hypothetical protein
MHEEEEFWEAFRWRPETDSAVSHTYVQPEFPVVVDVDNPDVVVFRLEKNPDYCDVTTATSRDG